MIYAIFTSVLEPFFTSYCHVYNFPRNTIKVKHYVFFFFNHSKSHTIALKEWLPLTFHGNKSISKFLNILKSITIKFPFIDATILDNDIVIYVLNGIGPIFKDNLLRFEHISNPSSLRNFMTNLWSMQNFWNKKKVV